MSGTVIRRGAGAAIRHDLWLVVELTRRDISQRYRGTTLGLLWPVLYAVMFLGIFSFVFSHLLGVRWGGAGAAGTGTLSGPLMIFCGIVPYLFIAEVIGRGPTFVLGSASLVKRVRFPTHLLPVIGTNAALLTTLINLALLLGFAVAAGSGGGLLMPLHVLLVMGPAYLFALGMGWLLGSVAVFFRDIGQVTVVVVQAMMFLSPVFYPLAIVPPEYHPLFAANPVTYFVEALREALQGRFDWGTWAAMLGVHGIVAALGFAVFRRLRPAFGDML